MVSSAINYISIRWQYGVSKKNAFLGLGLLQLLVKDALLLFQKRKVGQINNHFRRVGLI